MQSLVLDLGLLEPVRLTDIKTAEFRKPLGRPLACQGLGRSQTPRDLSPPAPSFPLSHHSRILQKAPSEVRCHLTPDVAQISAGIVPGNDPGQFLIASLERGNAKI